MWLVASERPAGGVAWASGQSRGARRVAEPGERKTKADEGRLVRE
jgi:hypothetical protein